MAPVRAHQDGRIGLVLGGGGAIGTAFHAGALAALEHDIGWDARSADVVVGTSAGSLIGALLRMGAPPSDLAALTVGARSLRTPEPVARALAARPSFAPFGLRHVLRPIRLPAPTAVASMVALPVRRGVPGLASLMTLLSDGVEELEPHVQFLDRVTERGWPTGTLLVCATRQRDCRRAVFGGERTPKLSAAVAASCAVPGYFRPVRIDDTAYVDGGAISPTNADVLRRHELDLAVVVSPMTGAGASRWSLSGAVRNFCRRSLDHEVAILERRGIETLVIEPGEESLQWLGTDFMSDEVLPEIVRSAFLDTGAQLAEHHSGGRVAGSAAS